MNQNQNEENREGSDQHRQRMHGGLFLPTIPDFDLLLSDAVIEELSRRLAFSDSLNPMTMEAEMNMNEKWAHKSDVVAHEGPGLTTVTIQIQRVGTFNLDAFKLVELINRHQDLIGQVELEYPVQEASENP